MLAEAFLVVRHQLRVPQTAKMASHHLGYPHTDVLLAGQRQGVVAGAGFRFEVVQGTGGRQGFSEKFVEAVVWV